MKHKEQILKLRSEGKSYREIEKITGASKGTISFHCGPGQKKKNYDRYLKNRSNRHPFSRKVDNFINTYKSSKERSDKRVNSQKKRLTLKVECFHRERNGSNIYVKPSFTYKDVIEKFGVNPKCYLTGVEIDIFNTSSYHFDHIVPASKGGENTIDNLGICTRNANHAKNDMMLEEFISLCKKVLEHNGYLVTSN